MATCARPDASSGKVEQRQSRFSFRSDFAQHCRRLASAAIALFPIVASAQLATTAWPKYLGGALNTSQGLGQGSTNSVKWTVTAQAPVNTSPAVGQGGTLYFGSDDFNVYAVNSATGVLKWSFPTQSYVESSPAVGSDGTVYIGGEDSTVYALNGSTGALKWSFPTTSFIDASPAVGADGTVYIGSTDGFLYALNGSTGALLWKFATQGAVESTPAIGSDGTVYFGSDDGNVYALVGKTGAVKWTYTLQVPIFNSPSVAADGTVLVGADAVYALAGNGTASPTLSWTQNFGFDVTSSISISTNGNLVVPTADGQVRLLSSTGVVQWLYQSPGGLYEAAPSIASDGTIILASDGGILSAVSSSGTELWEYSVASESYTSPATIDADGTLYLGGLSGNLLAFQSLTLQSLSISPVTVTGGSAATGVVTLSAAAPVAGSVINLSSDTNGVGVPSSITVPSGATTATFSISTTPVQQAAMATITASQGGLTKSAILNVISPIPTSVSVSPSSVVGGGTVTGTVQLSGPAPTGGEVVSLAASNGAASIPLSITIPAGDSSGSFTVLTATVTKDTNVTISAILGASSAATTLTVQQPYLSGLSVAPAAVVGGKIATGTVSLMRPAPPIGVTISLNSTSGASVPMSVTVPSGATSATFAVQTVGVSANSVVTLTASLSGLTETATLTLTPASLSQVSVSPNPAAGGSSPTGTVTLNGNAPPAGLQVSLSATGKYVSVPATATIPANSSSTIFVVSTKITASNQTSTITAKAGSASVTTMLTLTQNSEAGFSIAPNSVVGGSSMVATGTVTFNGPAPSAGELIKLVSLSPKLVVVPASVRLLGGKSSVSFPLTHKPVSSSTTVSVTATYGANSFTASLTLTPFAVQNLSLSPNSVGAGGKSTGTVTLNAAPGPSSGAVLVKLASSSKAVTVPATVSVPVGKASGSFSVSTTPSASGTTAAITATYASSSEQATLTVLPTSIASLTVSPASVKGSSSTTVTATVTLSGAAPAGGLVVTLTSSNPDAVSIPGTVTVPAGRTSAAFKVTHSAVSTQTVVTLSGTTGSVTKTAVLTVNP